MENPLTGNRDADLIILNNLNDRDLFNFCLSNKKAADLCRNENFWRNRFYQRYGKLFDNDQEFIDKIKKDEKWKTFYLLVVSETSEFKNNPWSFFDNVDWSLKNNQLHGNDDLLENFFFLDLGREVQLELPIDRYEDLAPEHLKISAEPFLTPSEVVNYVYQFYSEPVSLEDLRLQQELENPYADDFSEEDVIAEEVLRRDLLGDMYFEGFEHLGDNDGVPLYAIRFGS